MGNDQLATLAVLTVEVQKKKKKSQKDYQLFSCRRVKNKRPGTLFQKMAFSYLLVPGKCVGEDGFVWQGKPQW